MSQRTDWMNDVRKRAASLGTTATAIAFLLSGYADNAGELWPSVAKLAKASGTSRATVQRALSTLRDAGLLERTPTEAQPCLMRLLISEAPPRLISEAPPASSMRPKPDQRTRPVEPERSNNQSKVQPLRAKHPDAAVEDGATHVLDVPVALAAKTATIDAPPRPRKQPTPHATETAKMKQRDTAKRAMLVLSNAFDDADDEPVTFTPEQLAEAAGCNVPELREAWPEFEMWLGQLIRWKKTDDGLVFTRVPLTWNNAPLLVEQVFRMHGREPTAASFSITKVAKDAGIRLDELERCIATKLSSLPDYGNGPIGNTLSKPQHYKKWIAEHRETEPEENLMTPKTGWMEGV